jgi:hypothetical protein
MSRIRTHLAYGWAFLAAPLVLATFMGMDFFAGRLVAVTGLHVHPLYTGGEVAQTIDHGRYQTLIHRPVFDGLVGQREYGILQIQWQPKDANLPERIDEAIDLDADNTSEFTIRLNTKTNTADLELSGDRFLALDEVITVANTRVVRISLKRP